MGFSALSTILDNLTCFLMALGIEVTLGFLYPVKSLATMFFSKSPPFL